MSTYLITGGTGLVGNYVVRELVERGLDREEIVVYDLYPDQDVLDGIEDDVTLIRGDVTDTVQLMEAFSDYRPDSVVHLAALVTHQAWDDPPRAIEVNGIGTSNVFDAVRIFDVSTCIFASSASVYGTVADYGWKDEVVVDETDTVRPEHPYTATKYLNEVTARTYDEKYDPSYVGVRIGGVWGHGRTEGATGQLNAFVRDAGLGKDVTVPTYWTVWDEINLCYGRDVGRWFIDLAGRDDFDHIVYNQGSETAFTVDRIVETLERLQPEVEIRYPDANDGEEWEDEMANPGLDCTRWYDELGLTQEWEIEDAIVDYVNDCRRVEGLDTLAL